MNYHADTLAADLADADALTSEERAALAVDLAALTIEELAVVAEIARLKRRSKEEIKANWLAAVAEAKGITQAEAEARMAASRKRLKLSRLFD
jgi:hypothetical protein